MDQETQTSTEIPWKEQKLAIEERLGIQRNMTPRDIEEALIKSFGKDEEKWLAASYVLNRPVANDEPDLQILNNQKATPYDKFGVMKMLNYQATIAQKNRR